MAFGYRLRSQQSSRVQLEDPQRQQSMAQVAAQQPPMGDSGNNSSSRRQHIRLDGLQQRPTTAGASSASSNSSSNRALAGSVLETHTASFLDERAQTLDLAQLGRQRRGTTSTVYSASARSTTSSGESDHGRPPEAAVDVLYKGHLMAKRGLLKSLERRFYFVVRGRAELYVCKDETSFSLWLASGWGLSVDSAVAKGSGIAPQLVCTVLRADRAGDSGGSDRGLVIVASPPAGAAPNVKAASLKLYAETADKCQRWLHVLHRVQLTKRVSASASGEPQDAHSPHSSAAASSHGSSGASSKHASQRSTNQEDLVASPRTHQHVRARKSSRSDANQPPPPPSSSSSASGPRAYAGGQLRSNSLRDETGSVKSSGSSSDAASETTVSVRPNTLFGSALASNGSQGNVLLFVPAAGSAISVSDSKLAQARKQAAELAAKGVKRPTRGGMEGSTGQNQPIQWRYGSPEYALSDLEYMKHKQREHESTPLESYVEECCQTFLMEATHKANYNEWVSVRQEYFYLQVNDGERVAGHGIAEHDMFGLLYMPGVEVADADIKEGEEKDPRAILAEAFTEGFPMEVLEVFTQPPQCYFSWRHWGSFAGSYKGVKGDGSRVEVRGFGQMQIDSNRMLSLRLFFKAKELFDKLNTVSAALALKAREVQRSRATSSAMPQFPSSSTRGTVRVAGTASTPAASPAAPPAAAPTARVPTPTKSKAALTADIIDELSNFTIASAAVRSK